LLGLKGVVSVRFILKPEGGKGEDVSEAFGEGHQRWDGGGYDRSVQEIHVDERGCC